MFPSLHAMVSCCVEWHSIRLLCLINAKIISKIYINHNNRMKTLLIGHSYMQAESETLFSLNFQKIFKYDVCDFLASFYSSLVKEWHLIYFCGGSKTTSTLKCHIKLQTQKHNMLKRIHTTRKQFNMIQHVCYLIVINQNNRWIQFRN